MKNSNYIIFKILLILFGLNLISCSTYKAIYEVGLDNVEVPKDAQVQFGETNFVKFSDNNINKYKFEDNFVEMIWFVGESQLNFYLKNKSDYPLKINWDDVTYVDYNGFSDRVMHSGIKYIDRASSHPASIIPKGSSIDDMILPISKIYLLYSTWVTPSLIPCYYKKKVDFDREAEKWVGKTIKVLFPIVIENVQNNYVFEFKVNRLVNK
ncbi:MAG: hypothetical protein BGO29_11075 [Bacteroidales bacterium 36-12]|nr:MAG: hypothetical protein BGO29_11075 [Bacteroidales bacterium 36-12]